MNFKILIYLLIAFVFTSNSYAVKIYKKAGFDDITYWVFKKIKWDIVNYVYNRIPDLILILQLQGFVQHVITIKNLKTNEIEGSVFAVSPLDVKQHLDDHTDWLETLLEHTFKKHSVYSSWVQTEEGSPYNVTYI